MAVKKTQADRVRELLAQAGMGQREAARELKINERAMRGYCAGDKVPRYVILALERLVQMKEGGLTRGGEEHIRERGGAMSALPRGGNSMRVMYLQDIAHKRENYKMDLWTFAL